MTQHDIPAAFLAQSVLVRLHGTPSAYPVAAYGVALSTIIIPDCVATCFGGPADRGDDGSTASGVRTDVPPYVAGVALPMPISGRCRGTPLPTLPWGTKVWVALGDTTVCMPLVDVGPRAGLPSRAFIDITPAGWSMLLGEHVPQESAQNLSWRVSVYIPDVGKALATLPQFGVSRG